MSNVQFTDNSLMPLGKYKGKKLIEVPAHIFIYLWEQSWFDRTGPLGKYIEYNLQVLQKQEKEQQNLRR